MKRDIVAFVTVLGLASSGCRGVPSDESRLTVFAAASLTAAFRQMADTLRLRHPGIQIDFNFAASQVLVLQLTQGASADVFASADQHWMAVAEDSGLVEESPLIFAHNRLAVIVPARNPARIARLRDLERKGVKLVVAGEAVPAGAYARQVIANLAQTPGFPPDYESRVLANIVSNEETVKGVVTKVELGEADAGIVYITDVTAEVSAKVARIEIPEEQNVTAAYPIAALHRAGNPALAHEFVDLVLSGSGQRVLLSHGFHSPPI